MKRFKNERKLFLDELLKYAKESGNFNPHFYRKEMMEKLNITEGEFNVLQKKLGDKYCRFVDYHNGDDRYAINLSECEKLREKYSNHAQQIRIAIYLTILAALLAYVFK
ncbi:hypothetical protein ACFL5H_01770 [Candidatus Latescibacterota bacterium]